LPRFKRRVRNFIKKILFVKRGHTFTFLPGLKCGDIKKCPRFTTPEFLSGNSSFACEWGSLVSPATFIQVTIFGFKTPQYKRYSFIFINPSFYEYYFQLPAYLRKNGINFTVPGLILF